MKFTPFMRFLLVCLMTVSFAAALSADSFAQKKKPAAPASNKKPQPAKKDAKNVKTDKKQGKKEDKKSAKNAKNEKNSKDKNSSRETKTSKDGRSAKKADNSKNHVAQVSPKESKKQSAARRAEEARKAAERRKAEEERRQAALAEQRRREQLRREAEARRQAFERNLRQETIENIAKDDTTGEDLQIRQVAVEALGKRAGTVVVMEAQTGKILTVVNQEWAITKGFKPCSTIKLVTAAAGVEEDLIDEDGNLIKKSYRMNLDDALAYSNNTYFQKIGANLGSDKMISYAKALGLGEPTGFDPENETGGKLPYGNNNARIYSHGDDFEVTPLQLAVMVSAITNGGKVVIPQTPKNKIQKVNFQGYMRREISLPQENVRELIPGMIGATDYGTARRAAVDGLNVAGKTGSCIFDGTWIGLFASVAPVVKPKYSVVVITRGQSERGKYASAIAGQIYQALGARLDSEERRLIAQQPLILKPKQRINAQTSAALEESDDESEVSADAAEQTAAPKTKKGIVAQTTETAAPPKVQKTVQSQPVNPKPSKFSPVVIEFNRDGAAETDEMPEVNPKIIRPRVVKN